MFLATTTAANSGVMSTGMLIMWLVIMFGMMYFLMIRPQKKEQKKLQAMTIWEAHSNVSLYPERPVMASDLM